MHPFRAFDDYSVEGTGFNIKLGAIIRPFKYSPFKVGLYVHTPTWYELKNISSASIADPYGNVIDTRDYELYNDDLRVKCSLSTPWDEFKTRFTIGIILIISCFEQRIVHLVEI